MYKYKWKFASTFHSTYSYFENFKVTCLWKLRNFSFFFSVWNFIFWNFLGVVSKLWECNLHYILISGAFHLSAKRATTTTKSTFHFLTNCWSFSSAEKIKYKKTYSYYTYTWVHFSSGNSPSLLSLARLLTIRIEDIWTISGTTRPRYL